MSNQPTVTDLFNAYRERSARILATNPPAIPMPKPGSQPLVTELVGQMITMSELCPFSGRATIVDCYSEFGYSYYVATVGEGKHARQETLRQRDIDFDFSPYEQAQAAAVAKNRQLRELMSICGL